jgi:hypothetical protein
VAKSSEIPVTGGLQLSARPRAYDQDPAAAEAFKKMAMSAVRVVPDLFKL